MPSPCRHQHRPPAPVANIPSWKVQKPVEKPDPTPSWEYIERRASRDPEAPPAPSSIPHPLPSFDLEYPSMRHHPLGQSCSDNGLSSAQASTLTKEPEKAVSSRSTTSVVARNSYPHTSGYRHKTAIPPPRRQVTLRRG